MKKTDIQALFNMTRYFLYVQVTVLRNMHKKTPIYGVFLFYNKYRISLPAAISLLILEIVLTNIAVRVYRITSNSRMQAQYFRSQQLLLPAEILQNSDFHS